MEAVYPFNRVAQAIGAALARLSVACSSYVVDYPMVVMAHCAMSSVKAAAAALELLGRKVKEGDKLVPRQTFKALGVNVDLGRIGRNGVVVILNRTERVAEDIQTLDEVLAAGRAASAVAHRRGVASSVPALPTPGAAGPLPVGHCKASRKAEAGAGRSPSSSG